MKKSVLTSIAMRIPDRVLLIVALSVSCVGVSLLFILLGFDEPLLVEVAHARYVEQEVRVEGVARDVSVRGLRTTFTLVSECSLPVVYFDSVEVSEGQSVVVRGSSRTYNGKDEFVADEVLFNRLSG